jgi:hypothetical protein
MKSCSMSTIGELRPMTFVKAQVLRSRLVADDTLHSWEGWRWPCCCCHVHGAAVGL